MYSDIFESATFSFWIQKFHHAHVIGFVAELLFSTVEDGLKKNWIHVMLKPMTVVVIQQIIIDY